ncbi:DUF5777 family beta-barrel protein [Membranihabitans maritimus]|uniref:DUF5777 family beta-barrel protein n=1 Tax=Membranihabitans maritimus TaxID=2904244 RepID=UPI001F334919|nr:DUF5777 family beta-barrel protein [Membranihabitans maritimus]
MNHSLKLSCIFFTFFFLNTTLSNSQDLLDILESETPKTTEIVSAIFKGTRIANGHSVETRKKGVLEFLISHRFGRVNGGFYQLFGLDESNIRFALEYAVSDNFTLGLGRSSFDKSYDGFVKYRLLQQKTSQNTFPVSVTLVGSMAQKTLRDYPADDKPDFNDRLAYTTQVLIARKFNSAISLQVAPTYIHRNTVPTFQDPHDILALGIGGRMKITNQVSVNAEYFYSFNPIESITPRDAFSISVDIETGGHVFQLMMSNAITMIEKSFITETTGNFFSGDIHLGFNISRAFHLGNKK